MRVALFSKPNNVIFGGFVVFPSFLLGQASYIVSHPLRPTTSTVIIAFQAMTRPLFNGCSAVDLPSAYAINNDRLPTRKLGKWLKQ